MENPAKSIFNRQVLWQEIPYENKQFLDVLFISNRHVGVILDDYTFIHAAKKVQIERFNSLVLLDTKKVYRLWPLYFMK